jgi:hypothetical protein
MLTRPRRNTGGISSMNRVYSVSVLVALVMHGFLTARIEAQDTPHPVRFGINSFLGNLRHSEVRAPTTKTSPEDRTNYLDAARDSGVTTIRETFMNWAEIEPERGKGYHFAEFDDKKATTCSWVFSRGRRMTQIFVVSFERPSPDIVAANQIPYL